MIEITILLVMLLAGIAVGLYLRCREGTVRPATLDKDTDERAELLAAAGITGSGPACCISPPNGAARARRCAA